MANEVTKVNGIAIGSITNVNGITDSNLSKLNGQEFTGIVLVDQQQRSFTTVDSGGSAIGDAGEFDTNRAFGNSVAYDPDTSTIIVTYGDTGNSNRCTGRVATVSGNETDGFTLTFGSEIEIDDSGTCYHSQAFYNTGQDRLMVAYMTSSGNNGQYAKAMTVRGGTTRDLTTLGNHLSVESGQSGYNQNINSNMGSLNQAANSGNGILHICYEYGADPNDGNHIRAVRISDTSDNTTVVGDRAEFVNSPEEFYSITYDETAQKNVVVYDDGTTINARTVEHGGTNDMTTSFGTAASYGENSSLKVAEYYGGANSAYDPDQNKHHVLFRLDADSAGYLIYFSVSGTSVTWGATSKKQAVSSGTASGNETGGGVAYSHARDRIITYGSTASSTSANHTFESHSFDGTDYTSVGSAVTYDSRNGRARGANVMRTDASALIGNSVVLVHYIYGGSADGTTLITGLDAGNSGS
jgi:hypothetical protein